MKNQEDRLIEANIKLVDALKLERMRNDGLQEKLNSIKKLLQEYKDDSKSKDYCAEEIIKIINGEEEWIW